MSNTLETVTLGNSNDINDLVLLEDRVDANSLFEETVREFDFVSYAATIDLNFHDMGLLLLETGLADLSVGNDADDSAVLADTLELTLS